MPQKEIDETLELLNKYFGFLFQAGARVVFADYPERQYGNFAIVLEVANLHVGFFRDRGTITLQVGPDWGTVGWSGDPSYDLIIIIAFLTQKQVLISGYWKDRFKADRQLERLAKAFLFYYDQIAELFRSDIFPKKKDALDLVSRDIQSLIFEPRRRAELRKLEEQSAQFWRQVGSA